ncbi:hypothetical protein DFP73DRAFT_621004 [Morchella snyderi]|nr:hypothetical protein DFP73DRAFT_621004 [Morchella snyderi]
MISARSPPLSRRPPPLSLSLSRPRPPPPADPFADPPRRRPAEMPLVFASRPRRVAANRGEPPAPGPVGSLWYDAREEFVRPTWKEVETSHAAERARRQDRMQHAGTQTGTPERGTATGKQTEDRRRTKAAASSTGKQTGPPKQGVSFCMQTDPEQGVSVCTQTEPEPEIVLSPTGPSAAQEPVPAARRKKDARAAKAEKRCAKLESLLVEMTASAAATAAALAAAASAQPAVVPQVSLLDLKQRDLRAARVEQRVSRLESLLRKMTTAAASPVVAVSAPPPPATASSPSPPSPSPPPSCERLMQLDIMTRSQALARQHFIRQVSEAWAQSPCLAPKAVPVARAARPCPRNWLGLSDLLEALPSLPSLPPPVRAPATPLSSALVLWRGHRIARGLAGPVSVASAMLAVLQRAAEMCCPEREQGDEYTAGSLPARQMVRYQEAAYYRSRALFGRFLEAVVRREVRDARERSRQLLNVASGEGQGAVGPDRSQLRLVSPLCLRLSQDPERRFVFLGRVDSCSALDLLVAGTGNNEEEDALALAAGTPLPDEDWPLVLYASSVPAVGVAQAGDVRAVATQTLLTRPCETEVAGQGSPGLVEVMDLVEESTSDSFRPSNGSVDCDLMDTADETFVSEAQEEFEGVGAVDVSQEAPMPDAFFYEAPAVEDEELPEAPAPVLDEPMTDSSTADSHDTEAHADTADVSYTAVFFSARPAETSHTADPQTAENTRTAEAAVPADITMADASTVAVATNPAADEPMVIDQPAEEEPTPEVRLRILATARRRKRFPVHGPSLPTSFFAKADPKVLFAGVRQGAAEARSAGISSPDTEMAETPVPSRAAGEGEHKAAGFGVPMPSFLSSVAAEFPMVTEVLGTAESFWPSERAPEAPVPRSPTPVALTTPVPAPKQPKAAAKVLCRPPGTIPEVGGGSKKARQRRKKSKGKGSAEDKGASADGVAAEPAAEAVAVAAVQGAAVADKAPLKKDPLKKRHKHKFLSEAKRLRQRERRETDPPPGVWKGSPLEWLLEIQDREEGCARVDYFLRTGELWVSEEEAARVAAAKEEAARVAAASASADAIMASSNALCAAEVPVLQRVVPEDVPSEAAAAAATAAAGVPRLLERSPLPVARASPAPSPSTTTDFAGAGARVLAMPSRRRMARRAMPLSGGEVDMSGGSRLPMGGALPMTNPVPAGVRPSARLPLDDGSVGQRMPALTPHSGNLGETRGGLGNQSPTTRGVQGGAAGGGGGGGVSVDGGRAAAEAGLASWHLTWGPHTGAPPRGINQNKNGSQHCNVVFLGPGKPRVQQDLPDPWQGRGGYSGGMGERLAPGGFACLLPCVFWVVGVVVLCFLWERPAVACASFGCRVCLAGLRALVFWFAGWVWCFGFLGERVAAAFVFWLLSACVPCLSGMQGFRLAAPAPPPWRVCLPAALRLLGLQFSVLCLGSLALVSSASVAVGFLGCLGFGLVFSRCVLSFCAWALGPAPPRSGAWLAVSALCGHRFRPPTFGDRRSASLSASPLRLGASGFLFPPSWSRTFPQSWVSCLASPFVPRGTSNVLGLPWSLPNILAAASFPACLAGHRDHDLLPLPPLLVAVVLWLCQKNPLSTGYILPVDNQLGPAQFPAAYNGYTTPFVFPAARRQQLSGRLVATVWLCQITHCKRRKSPAYTHQPVRSGQYQKLSCRIRKQWAVKNSNVKSPAYNNHRVRYGTCRKSPAGTDLTVGIRPAQHDAATTSKTNHLAREELVCWLAGTGRSAPQLSKTAWLRPGFHKRGRERAAISRGDDIPGPTTPHREHLHNFLESTKGHQQARQRSAVTWRQFRVRKNGTNGASLRWLVGASGWESALPASLGPGFLAGGLRTMNININTTTTTTQQPSAFCLWPVPGTLGLTTAFLLGSMLCHFRRDAHELPESKSLTEGLPKGTSGRQQLATGIKTTLFFLCLFLPRCLCLCLPSHNRHQRTRRAHKDVECLKCPSWIRRFSANERSTGKFRRSLEESKGPRWITRQTFGALAVFEGEEMGLADTVECKGHFIFAWWSIIGLPGSGPSVCGITGGIREGWCDEPSRSQRGLPYGQVGVAWMGKWRRLEWPGWAKGESPVWASGGWALRGLRD